jgi:hypothetical protein
MFSSNGQRAALAFVERPSKDIVEHITILARSPVRGIMNWSCLAVGAVICERAPLEPGTYLRRYRDSRSPFVNGAFQWDEISAGGARRPSPCAKMDPIIVGIENG